MDKFIRLITVLVLLSLTACKTPLLHNEGVVMYVDKYTVTVCWTYSDKKYGSCRDFDATLFDPLPILHQTVSLNFTKQNNYEKNNAPSAVPDIQYDMFSTVNNQNFP